MSDSGAAPSRVWLLAFAVALAGLTVLSAEAQETVSTETVSVFQDCQTFGCDSDFFRTEINFVNWVRDREAADVHVLITAQATGGGGRLYTLEFIGRDAFDGRTFDMTWASSGDSTDDDVRRGLARTLKYGLMPFVAERTVADELSVIYEPPEEGREGAAPGSGVAVDDPWDFWVFTARLNAFLNGESSISSQNLSGSLSARRTTEDWKISLSVHGNRQKTEYDLEDRVVESIVEDWSSSGMVARSAGDHWTVGLRGNAGSSTFRNQRLALRFAPGLEYNFFPYSESTTRELTLLYSVGANYFDYNERTIFLEDEETRLDQSLTAQLDLNRPWGQVSLFADASHYLHDTRRWRTTVGGSFEVRLFKGLRFNAGGNYSWIRDQLHIPGEDATDDEILTRQRQLATDFSYFTHFGLSYTFGSIYNNVVNPRFGGGGGFGFIFF
jgi:hypothetical protein